MPMQPSPIAETRRPADPRCRVITGRPPPYRVPAKPTPIALDARTAPASLHLAVCGAPFPVMVAMFVDAARPHPGGTWRAWVLTGLAEEIGVRSRRTHFRARSLELCLQSGAVPSGITWHVAAKMA